MVELQAVLIDLIAVWLDLDQAGGLPRPAQCDMKIGISAWESIESVTPPRII
jgi:hypothetical protein